MIGMIIQEVQHYLQQIIHQVNGQMLKHQMEVIGYGYQDMHIV